jgi:hypothetical protein
MGLDWYPQCAYVQSSKGSKQMTFTTFLTKINTILAANDTDDYVVVDLADAMTAHAMNLSPLRYARIIMYRSRA